MHNTDALPDLLSRCTARLVINGGVENGTGFFVAPGYLLTCAHVVIAANDDQGRVDAVWNGQKYPATIEQITDKTYPDLALLKVAGLINSPCAYLYDEIHLNDDLYTYGYPPNYPAGDSIISRYVGPTGEPQTLLTFTQSNVRPGFSGSPLLNLHTGAVCGVVKRTTGENTLLGGRGVPIERALQEFPLLRRLQEHFHSQNQQWAACLTPRQRQANGLSKLIPSLKNEEIELFFSYHYNPRDLELFDELCKQITILKNQKIIKDFWHAGKLLAGDEVQKITSQHLNSAHIILLLISPDYLADDWLYQTQVKRAMERRAANEATVIAVLLRPTFGWKETLFGQLGIIPQNEKPMSKWGNKDDFSVEVAKKIRDVVRGLQGERH